MNAILTNHSKMARFWSAFVLLSLFISMLPAFNSVAEAASVGITSNSYSLNTTVDDKVNFVITVTDDGETTPGTVVSVSDVGGGTFYTGTIGGACNSDTPDSDNEFAITNNKGICYSNSVPGEWNLIVQLLDGSLGLPVGDSIEITVNVEEVEVADPILGCTNADAINYNEEATQDDKSCVLKVPDEDLEVEPIFGCMDYSAENYNPSATEEGEVLCIYTSDNEDSNQCVDNTKDWADNVHFAQQAKLKNGSDITDVNRTNPDATLGEADWTNGGETGFYSLGFGGSIKVAFDSYVLDVEGADISIHEATNGASYPLEKAEIWVSQNGDDWFMIGYADNTSGDRVTYLDISSSGLAWISYVKVIDVSDSSLHIATADGFDLDAVDATETVCTKPEPKPVEQCEFEGHKYNQAGTPLQGWMMGLMKVVTFSDDSTAKYDVSTSTTDVDGYYCLEWDGYTNTPVHDPNTKSFAYRVYEVLKGGWSYLSVEKGPVNTTPEVVDDQDVLVEDGRVSVQVGATNGYVYANAAYHVDFYNYEEDGNGGSNPEVDTYRIKGYVWHDDNENEIWDGQTEEQFAEQYQAESEESESPLVGWTVNITNGTTSLSTTTDEQGYYYFDVPAGTWTITEVVEEGWGATTVTEYVVTVPEVPVVTFVDKVINFIIPTTYAAVIAEYGFYDFGNNELLIPVTDDTTSGSGGRRSSGGSTSTVLPIPLVAGVTDSTPEGSVLGEQVSIVPYGAAGAGAGGTSNSSHTIIVMLLAALLVALTSFVTRNFITIKL